MSHKNSASDLEWFCIIHSELVRLVFPILACGLFFENEIWNQYEIGKCNLYSVYSLKTYLDRDWFYHELG